MNTEKKIASYEDACRVLNIQPINEEAFNIFPKEDQRKRMEVLPAIPLCKCRAFVRVYD